MQVAEPLGRCAERQSLHNILRTPEVECFEIRVAKMYRCHPLGRVNCSGWRQFARSRAGRDLVGNVPFVEDATLWVDSDRNRFLLEFDRGLKP